jgi:glycosyltransferase involved in cell wall biosynthesis
MTQTVVYYTDSSSFGGVERAMLQHIEWLDRNIWQPVLVHHPGTGISALLEGAAYLDARLVEMPALPLGLRGARNVPSFVSMLHAEHPAVFHAHLSWPLACKWGLAAALYKRVPAVVATLHLWVDTPYSPASKWQQSIIATRLGKYITVSRDIAHKLEHIFKVPSSKLQVIHSSVDIQRFEHAINLASPAELALIHERPIILTVARLDQQKGLQFLLEAAAQVPEAVFVIVGEGPERIALEKQSQDLSLENRVIFAGFHQDIPAWLGHCTLFVLPSLYEGVPISLLEAMAAGKPVIASAIPGNMEALTHAESGWLVPPGDADALANAIRLLLANPTLAEQLASAGQSRVKIEFSTQAMNQQVVRVYDELLDKTQEGKRLHA